MDHIDIPHIHQYIYTVSMPAPMVLLRSPTNFNTLPMTGINSSLYTIFNINTISEGVTPQLGHLRRAQWLRGRAPDSRLREPGFESCAVVLKPWASFFTLHCSSSLSCINE